MRLIHLLLIYNGEKYPAFAGYRRNCTSFCTTFALKTMRSFICSFAQTMMQTMYQPMCRTIYQTICEPIPFFARHSARDLTHFHVTEND